MRPFDLVYVSPQPIDARLPARPGMLLDALRSSEAVCGVTVVNRRPPSDIGRFLRSRSLTTTSPGEGTSVVIEHPWPFGPLEQRWVARLVHRTLSSTDRDVVLWISDPKSADVFASIRPVSTTRLIRVFDAYDAWDLSPLVRGRWRRAAVSRGYRSAAHHADIVFATTSFMARRMKGLGASRVTVLQNAAPPTDGGHRVSPPADGPPSLAYVGRIHERLDCGLLAAVADAFPAVAIRLVGPVEREPDGWSDLIARPNVRCDGILVGEGLQVSLAAVAGLLLPHRVDDYTRSQDAMKAWDGLASGLPLISTPIPPADGWPEGLAEVCPDERAFVEAAGRALSGQLEAGRATRLAFAAENQWSARAKTALEAIGDLGPDPARAAP